MLIFYCISSFFYLVFPVFSLICAPKAPRGVGAFAPLPPLGLPLLTEVAVLRGFAVVHKHLNLSALHIPGVTKYLPRGLQYGSWQLENNFKCEKHKKNNFWSNKIKSKAIALDAMILQKFP